MAQLVQESILHDLIIGELTPRIAPFSLIEGVLIYEQTLQGFFACKEGTGQNTAQVAPVREDKCCVFEFGNPLKCDSDVRVVPLLRGLDETA